MKRVRLIMLVLSALIVMPASADEGMWLLPLLEKMNIKIMQEKGCKLSAEEIYSINNSSIKDAIVIFGGGCTGEIVSNEGLLLTNHHCGYGAIQALSSVDHDYLKDGYWAMDRSQELPAKGLSVSFLESFTDVTKDVEKAVKRCNSDSEREAAYKEVTDQLVLKAEKQFPNTRALVQSFYGGNAYYLIVYKIFNDVRFVGAPPSSIGKFGADTDNWMWPRHTCDFSMFRVYADKDNNPAQYSPDNVPYQPKKSLKISLKGVQEGDFNMIMGFPGSTNRFMTASELRERRDITNAISIQCRGIRQEILMEDMLADPKIKIQYASKYSGSSNGWKKNIGMNETFGKLDVESRRAADEKQFNEWASRSGARFKKYGEALSKIDAAVEGRATALRTVTYLTETIGRIEISSVAAMATSAQRNQGKTTVTNGNDNVRRILARLERFYKDYSMATDKKVAKRMLELFKESVQPSELIDVYNIIDNQFGGDISKYVDYLYENSLFSSYDKIKVELEKNGVSNLDSDPAVVLAKEIAEDRGILYGIIGKYTQGFSEGKKEYIAGQLEMRGAKAAIYPDANFTMRLTYGTVMPYSPRDAVKYNYYTTLKGVMEKEDPNNWEFIVPSKLKDLYAAKDYGQYADANGDLVTCFIMNGDITGGNSGSPTLDAEGNLIGLAFDGNWEAMSGDIIFEPDYQRCICVDIRYVLFIVDKFGGAGYLLNEMDIIK